MVGSCSDHVRISPGNQPHQNRSTHHNHGTVWASQSLVTLCTFYRQICSLTYSFFSWKLPPPACPALLVYHISYIIYHISYILYHISYIIYHIISYHIISYLSTLVLYKCHFFQQNPFQIMCETNSGLDIWLEHYQLFRGEFGNVVNRFSGRWC